MFSKIISDSSSNIFYIDGVDTSIRPIWMWME